MGRVLTEKDVEAAVKGGSVYAAGGGGWADHGRMLGYAAVSVGKPELVDIEDVSVADKDEQTPEENMDRDLLHAAILKLEAEYREPLLLQVIGGFSGKEIADILDLNSNTVMTRLFRARSKLKDVFVPEGDESLIKDADSE